MSNADEMRCARAVDDHECDGEMDTVESEGGTVWGWICKRCNRSMEKCQECGKAFASQKEHFRDHFRGMDVQINKCGRSEKTAAQRAMHAAMNRRNP